MNWEDKNWTDTGDYRRTYEDLKEEIRRKQEEARRLRDEAKQKTRAAIDPMTELAKLASSTHKVGEHVTFGNGWKCYINRKEGESRFSFTQITPQLKDGMHYTQLTPVQVVREMYKVSQYA